MISFRTFSISDPAYENDGLRMVTVKSSALGRRANVSLWVPSAEQIGTLLILMHGVYSAHWAWSMKGGVHRTAQRMLTAGEIAPMVIAMPDDGLRHDGSGYLTWPGAEDVEHWIVNEVPAIARRAVPALLPDTKIAIAGLSMGGYGALRLGGKYADRFCAISAHSSITDVQEMTGFVEEPLADYLRCSPREELSAIYWLHRNRERLAPLRFDCGTEDNLLEPNRKLHETLVAYGIAHEYSEFPGGHEWSYWQQHVAETLRFADKHSRGKHV